MKLVMCLGLSVIEVVYSDSCGVSGWRQILRNIRPDDHLVSTKISNKHTLSTIKSSKLICLIVSHSPCLAQTNKIFFC